MLAVDFLFHKRLYRAAQEVLLSRWGPSACPTRQPLAMLDLGCGDAQQIAATLSQCGAPGGNLSLASYTGVDMSAPALAIAQRNLAFLQPACTVSLLQVRIASGRACHAACLPCSPAIPSDVHAPTRCEDALPLAACQHTAQKFLLDVGLALPPPSLPCLQQDMTTFVEACLAGQFDLIFASFAVHHLRCGCWLQADKIGRNACLHPPVVRQHSL